MSIYYNQDKLAEVLLKGNYVEQADVDAAQEAADSQGISLVNVLVSRRLTTKDLIGQAVAEYLKVPYADLNSFGVNEEFINLIPEQTRIDYRIVTFKKEGKKVVLTTDDPERAQKDQAEVFDPLFKEKVEIAYSLPEDIDQALRNFRPALNTRFSDIIEGSDNITANIIEEIVHDALDYKASDIHFEPRKHDVLIRFRVDGVLQEAGHLSHEHYANVLNSIKLQSNLRIDEHYTMQDGAVRIMHKDSEVNLRVSIAPMTEGEKLVIRVLSQYINEFSLETLGIGMADKEIIGMASKKPFGMIIVAGPTGSGKTTTLYTLLKDIRDSRLNITTIEDPVEYRLEGINQMQVDTEKGISFSKGLRSLVRQDPDVMLVGEIRDRDTADIAVNAALTGHLLLSSFHANDAATVIPRMLDMGIEPYLLASTLEVIVAQRLVRRICERARYSYEIRRTELKRLIPEPERYFDEKTITLYKGKVNVACGGMAYQGRTVVAETIVVTPEMRELILTQPTAEEVRDLAYRQGTRSMFEDGIEKVKAGITSLEELLRVTQPPEIKRG